MDHLNKQQLILLALLVSFVTSIATGVVTVSLVNQAPPGVTQTINRVVEKTIERVVSQPATVSDPQQVIRETVVVKEDDMVVSAVDNSTKSMIRIYRTNSDPTAGSESMNFVSLGTIVSDDGIVATDNGVISSGGKYFTTLSDGKLRELTIVRSKSNEQVALFKISKTDKEQLTFDKIKITDQNELKLGQTVVFIGGETRNMVSTGIVSSFSTKDVKIGDNATSSDAQASSTLDQIQKIIVAIETSVPNRDFVSGGILLNLSGQLVGMKVTYMDSARTDLFLPSKAIKDAMVGLAEEQSKSQ